MLKDIEKFILDENQNYIKIGTMYCNKGYDSLNCRKYIQCSNVDLRNHNQFCLHYPIGNRVNDAFVKEAYEKIRQWIIDCYDMHKAILVDCLDNNLSTCFYKEGEMKDENN